MKSQLSSVTDLFYAYLARIWFTKYYYLIIIHNKQDKTWKKKMTIEYKPLYDCITETNASFTSLAMFLASPQTNTVAFFSIIKIDNSVELFLMLSCTYCGDICSWLSREKHTHSWDNIPVDWKSSSSFLKNTILWFAYYY